MFTQLLHILSDLGPLDQFVTNPVATVVRAIGHDLVFLCRSLCQEKEAQLLSPLMNSQYFLLQLDSAVSCFCVQYTFSCWQN